MLVAARNIFHHLIWKRIPRTLRRNLLIAAASRLAARPSIAAAHHRGPIYVAGVLRSATGLGEAARTSAAALRAAGLDVRAIDLTVPLMQPLSLPVFEGTVPASQAEGPGVLLLFVNGPLVPLALIALGRRMIRDKRIIGCWAWELPDLPPDWTSGIALVHEIWVPSRFVADAVTRRTPKAVHIVPHPVTPVSPALDIPWRKPAGCFGGIILFDLGSSIARKNPLAAIEAWRLAFGARSDCALTIKVSNAHLRPTAMRDLRLATADLANVTIIEELLAPDVVQALIGQSDVLLSLHRSEGFGLSLADAMYQGRVALATAWSGNMEFMSEDTGILVPYRLVAARDDQHTYDMPDQVWAEADVEAAAEQLRRLKQDLARIAQLGSRAARHMREHFSIAAYSQKALSALADFAKVSH